MTDGFFLKGLSSPIRSTTTNLIMQHRADQRREEDIARQELNRKTEYLRMIAPRISNEDWVQLKSTLTDIPKETWDMLGPIVSSQLKEPEAKPDYNPIMEILKNEELSQSDASMQAYQKAAEGGLENIVIDDMIKSRFANGKKQKIDPKIAKFYRLDPNAEYSQKEATTLHTKYADDIRERIRKTPNQKKNSGQLQMVKLRIAQNERKQNALLKSARVATVEELDIESPEDRAIIKQYNKLQDGIDTKLEMQAKLSADDQFNYDVGEFEKLIQGKKKEKKKELVAKDYRGKAIKILTQKGFPLTKGNIDALSKQLMESK